jgi:large subunit ribosomal protein L5e
LLLLLLSQVFACLKGALDGGLDIPHNEKRFVGFSDKKLDAEVKRGGMSGVVITGGTV